MKKGSIPAGIALSEELLSEVVGGLVVSDGGVNVYIVEPGHNPVDLTFDS